MALAVNVGSLVEEEHERGVAHILEHLAFSGTEKYSNHDIVRFLESIGAEFGACQNAHTSFDETVYELLVPYADISKGLEVFSQFAFHISCDEADLERERGPVLEEWRGTRSVEGRAAEVDWKIMCQGCKYAERLPIGLEDVIQNVPAQTVKAFYQRWYRPENMAVILVGPIADTDSVVRNIERELSERPSQIAYEPKIQTSHLPEHSTPRYHAYVDHEQQDASVQIVFQRPAPRIQTAQDLRSFIVEDLFQTAINNRLFKLSRRRSPPFYNAMMSSGSASRTIFSSGIGAVVQDDGHQMAIKTLLVELARVRLHGFSSYELKAARAQQMSEAACSYKERGQVYSTDLREEYVRHFLTGELVVGREKEAKLTKTLLPTITEAISREVLKAIVVEVERMEKDSEIAYEEDVGSTQSILTAPPTPGKVARTKELALVGAKELMLENGMKVYYKKTAFLDDQVLITGIAQGGLSEVDAKSYRSCRYAFRAAREVGEFGIPPEVLAELLMGKRVVITLDCSNFSRQIYGEQSPADLETSFQLLHRLFTYTISPADGDLETGLKYLRESFINEARNPMKQFLDRAKLINHNQTSHLYQPMTVKELDQLNSDLAFRFFNSCFKNPAQFVICLTGSFEEADVVSLVERYFASLPAVEQPEVLQPYEVTNVPDDFPQQVVQEDIRASMREPQGVALITIPVIVSIDDGLIDQTKIFTVIFCSQLLETRLLSALRFKIGKVYSVTVTLNWRSPPSETDNFMADLSIAFTCDPFMTTMLTELAIKELEELQGTTCSTEEVEALLVIEQQQWESQQEENSFWHNTLASAYASRYYRKTGDLEGAVKRRDDARKSLRAQATPEMLLQGFRSYLPSPLRNRYTAITFSPRKPTLGRLKAFFMPAAQSKAAAWATGILTLAAGAVLVLRCLQKRQ